MRRPFLMYLGPSSCSSLYVIQAPIAGPEDQLRETEVVQWPQSLIFIGGFLSNVAIKCRDFAFDEYDSMFMIMLSIIRYD